MQLEVSKGKGLEVVIQQCLGRRLSLAKVALEFLAELMNNNIAREKMEHERSFFFWIVTRRLSEEDAGFVKLADTLLDRCSDKEKNIVQMAELNWYGPLVKWLHEGGSSN